MSTDRALEAARRIVAWREVAGDGPADAWPTTCGDAVDVARALLALSEEVGRMRWQTIESAPIDGTEVDLWCVSTSRRVTDCWFADECWWHNDGNSDWPVHNATHWMPLPTPPSSQPGNREVTR